MSTSSESLRVYHRIQSNRRLSMEFISNSTIIANSSFLTNEKNCSRTWNEVIYIQILMTTLYAMILPVSLIGNAVVITVITRNKTLHTATNYYLRSMSISDVLLLMTGIPWDINSLWSKNRYIFGKQYAIFYTMVLEMSTNASILTVTVFTVERYIAICHPIRTQTSSISARVHKCILGIWLFATLTAAAAILLNPHFDDRQMNLGVKIYVALSIIYFAIPMLFIAILYALIIKQIQRSAKFALNVTKDQRISQKSNSYKELSSTYDVIKMLVAVVVLFFICFAPLQIQRILAMFADYSNADHFIINRILMHISGATLYLSTCINPILYHTMSNRFRQAVRKTFPFAFRRHRHGRPKTASTISISATTVETIDISLSNTQTKTTQNNELDDTCETETAAPGLLSVAVPSYSSSFKMKENIMGKNPNQTVVLTQYNKFSGYENPTFELNN